MHSDLPKVDVQKTRVRFTENAEQLPQFRLGNLPWLSAYLPKPKAPQEMRARLGNNVSAFERIALRIFAFLRNHHRSTSFQGSDLPIDMQHLRFEKRRAITSNDCACVGCCAQRPTLDAQPSASKHERPGSARIGSPLPSQGRGSR